MRQETVQFFTEKEEEFANLLVQTGMNKNVAKVLVFLANTKEATSRSIERGTDMRQPEVSLAVKYLMDQDWIRIHEKKSEGRGRSTKVYDLAKPISEIVNKFEDERKEEINKHLVIIKKLKNDLIGSHSIP
jgi:predicted transcriptional regulator